MAAPRPVSGATGYKTPSRDIFDPMSSDEKVGSIGTTVEITSLAQERGRVRWADPQHMTRRSTEPKYKCYKRRWFGLLQLVLFNLMFGWNWITFPSVAVAAGDYFSVSQVAINALSISYIGMLCLSSPVVTWVINRYGTRPAFIIAGLTLLMGNWIRYLGTEGWNFGVILFANLLVGTGASFALILPSHYSDLWFSPDGRMTATAVASLANPAGSAIGQLVSPVLGPTVQTLPWMVLVTAIVSTAASLGTFFVPAKPPTPASASHSRAKVPTVMAFLLIIRNKDFWLLLIPLAAYVGLFNSMASLLYNIFCPYSEDQDFTGVCGAICICSGLVAAAILSPVISRQKSSLIALKILAPIIALCHLAFIWIPQAQSLSATLVVVAILGAATFSLIPITLEYLVDILHPIAPENSSSLCWAAGQLLGIVFISIMEVLTAGDQANPPQNMKTGLVLQASVGLAVTPLILCLGAFGHPPANTNGDPRAVAQIQLPHSIGTEAVTDSTDG